MTIAHDIVAQLEGLWENAEPGPTKEGDAIIYRFGEGDFKIEPSAAMSRDSRDCIRALERAKPKVPEWEAVVASDLHDETHKREVYFRTADGGWESDTRLTCADDLVDPVPLVELPEREDLLAALEEGWDVWVRDEKRMRGADAHRVDALLKMLKRR